jgi:hypothetical protein
MDIMGGKELRLGVDSGKIWALIVQDHRMSLTHTAKKGGFDPYAYVRVSCRIAVFSAS